MAGIKNVATGLWNNGTIWNLIRNLIQINSTITAKGHPPATFFGSRQLRGLEVLWYALKNLPIDQFKLKDLLMLSYAEFLRLTILNAIRTPSNDYLDIEMHQQQSLFIEMIDEIIAGNARRAVNDFRAVMRGFTDAEFATLIATDRFEQGLDQDAQRNAHNHLKVRETIEGYAKVENRMKMVFAKTMLTDATLLDQHYKTRFPTTEERIRHIREYLLSLDARAKIEKTFEQYFYQDDYFQIFREIYFHPDHT